MALPRTFDSYKSELVAIASDVASSVLAADKEYIHANMKESIKRICDGILERAREETTKAFKLVVNAAIIQRGNGLVFHSSVFWDPSSDGVITHTIQSDAYVCVINIFGCAA